MLVDSHCHLDFQELHKNLPNLILNAKKNGIITLLTIGTQRSNISAVKKISQDYENIWCSIGIHPHSAITDYLNYDELLY